jgi:hypothetical protein
MRYRGVTPSGSPLWTTEEDETCREYGNDYRVLKTKLPHRSYHALRKRCQSLGLRPRRDLITIKELSLLRRMSATATSDEIQAALPHKTRRQLDKLRQYYGICSKRRPFSPTGYLILDEIRSRCFELNYSMLDLDKLAKSKTYFRQADWRRSGLNYRAIGRAVAALEGELTVHWRDE